MEHLKSFGINEEMATYLKNHPEQSNVFNNIYSNFHAIDLSIDYHVKNDYEIDYQDEERYKRYMQKIGDFLESCEEFGLVTAKQYNLLSRYRLRINTRLNHYIKTKQK